MLFQTQPEPFAGWRDASFISSLSGPLEPAETGQVVATPRNVNTEQASCLVKNTL